VHLLGKAQLVLPAWEPDQGWRVLDPDGHLVDAGPKTIARPAFDVAATMGITPDELQWLMERRELGRRG
jgi:hypothetical protein